MKIITLLCAAMLCCGASATEIFETPLDNGMDNAIVKAFSDATSANVTDPSNSLSLEDIRTTIETISINGNNLCVSFNDEKVKNLLSSKGIGVWNGETGTIVAWIADLSSADSSLLSGEGEAEFVKKLQGAASQNKFNIMFPVMDLDDVQQVNSQTIVSHSDELIAKASKRYDAKYFVSGVMERDSANNGYSVKWNLCDAEGKSLGSGANSGDADTATSQMSAQIAQVLMNSSNTGSTAAPAAPVATSANEADTITPVTDDGSIALGPVKGGVRVLITDIENVADYPRIKRILITYGYESDIQVLGYNSEGVIFLIPTGSSPAILDGTFTHASEFTKVAPWTYRFNESKGAAKPADNVGSVTTTTTQRVTSSINNYGNEAYTKETVKQTVEVTTTVPAQKPAGDTSNDVPVITITDDSDNSSVALER